MPDATLVNSNNHERQIYPNYKLKGLHKIRNLPYLEVSITV